MDTKTFTSKLKSRQTEDEQYFHLKHLEPGTIINNKYRIDDLIGEGGFGIVFRAFDLELKMEVALKFLAPQNTNDSRKFIRVQREIKISRRISDNRLVRIFSLEKWHSIYFLVMEYIKGSTLKALIQEKGRLSWREFREFYIQILEAMRSLHKAGIIHRDLKPGNIIIMPEGRIKILDFGLSKDLSDIEKTSSIGEVVGTPRYMSPEQIYGQEIDLRSDIFQLGLILYKTLSGSHPFGNSSTIETLVKHVKERHQKISTNGIKIPKYVEYVIEKSLEKKRNMRFRSIQEMLPILKRGKVPLVKRIYRQICLSPMRNLIISVLLIGGLVLGYLHTVGSKTLGSVEAQGSRLMALNKFGFKVWEKDFAPFTIVHVDQINSVAEDLRVPGFYKDFFSDQIVRMYLKNPKNGKFSPDISINSGDCDDRFLLLDKKGNIHQNRDFSNWFVLQTYDFSKTFYISRLNKFDIDEDGKRESIFTLNHTNGMFPSSLIVEGDLFQKKFVNPGYVSLTKFIKGNSQTSLCLVTGHNNLMAHSLFFAEVDFFNDKSSYAIPNLRKQTDHNFNGFMVFLPQGVAIFKDLWLDKGEMHFRNKRTNEEIVIFKDYTLKIKSGTSTKIFKDDASDIKRIYFLINKSFQEKVLQKSVDKAYATINQCFEHPVQSPYLISILLFFKGDLEILKGDYQRGEKTLKRALNHHPHNPDAAQRLAELLFLKRKPIEAKNKVQQEYDSIHFFMDRFVGKELFEVYCQLQIGNFYEAELAIAKIVKKKPDKEKNLRAIVGLFRGNYKNAAQDFNFGTSTENHLFTVIEKRLFMARAFLLAGVNLDRAEFYLNDIAEYSIYRKHLAEVSISYLLAQKGKMDAALRLVKKSFERILELSVGDFETRLWLFYDAYIYAKTMDILGHTDEAKRGYKICIKSNPYTDLAQRSKSALENNF
jgi:serine/threonine protein kinase/tetratricopeptide (TPR) repeat protein